MVVPMTNLGNAMFLLNNLPFANGDVHDYPHPIENHPEHPYYMPMLAAAYFRPLQQILSSDLNASGFVKAIYVNFGFNDYYELNPLVTFPTTVQAFELMLCRLFLDLTILDPLTNNQPWRKINNLQSLISNLPGSERDPRGIIGCEYGDVPQYSFEMQNYMDDEPDWMTYLLVVGRIDKEQIEEYIDDYVKVAEHDLNRDYCLPRIIRIMENKWGILSNLFIF